MRGREWICVAIDRRMGGKAWKALLFLFILLPSPLVSLVWVASVSERERAVEYCRNESSPLSCALAICLLCCVNLGVSFHSCRVPVQFRCFVVVRRSTIVLGNQDHQNSEKPTPNHTVSYMTSQATGHHIQADANCLKQAAHLFSCGTPPHLPQETFLFKLSRPRERGYPRACEVVYRKGWILRGIVFVLVVWGDTVHYRHLLLLGSTSN